MKRKLFAVAAMALLLAGCAGVPATKLGINPQTGVVNLDSPKEITITNLDITLSKGDHFILNGYSSKNSPDVIAAVAKANADMADKLLQLVDKLSKLAEQGALKAGTGGLAP